MPKHKSDSSAQQAAEVFLLRSLAETIGASFLFDASLPINLGVRPDGIDLEKKIVVEAYARVGTLKGAQLHKAKADLLKLAYIRRMLGDEWRAIVCFGSKEAAAFLLGKSWAAQAARVFGIEIFIQELPPDQRESVLSAQREQRMVNWE